MNTEHFSLFLHGSNNFNVCKEKGSFYSVCKFQTPHESLWTFNLPKPSDISIMISFC